MLRHATIVNEDDEALEFRHGVVTLFSAIAADFGYGAADDHLNTPWPYRQVTFAFDQVINRLRYTLFQLDRSALLLARSRSLLEDPNNQLERLEGRDVRELPPLQDAWADIALYSDSILQYLKQHADALADATTWLYPPDPSPPTRSFNRHYTWIKKHPDFDPVYLDILNRHREWYERLAGRETAQGTDTSLRTAITHRYPRHSFRTRAVDNKISISLGLWTLPKMISAPSASGQQSDNGWFSEDLLDELPKLVAGYCALLDDLYEHFVGRLRGLAGQADGTQLARVVREDPPFLSYATPALPPSTFNHWLFPRCQRSEVSLGGTQ